MLKRMEELICAAGLIPRGSRVLCALSGGADSVCLLAGLYRLREKLDFTLCAAHYDHQLRGGESRRDAAFVRELVDGRFPGVELRVGAGDVAGKARELGQGLEETARQMRYAFLEEAAAELGCDRIATAHTADDNAETVLLHLCRGTGLQGLCGIRPMRGKIIRPMLTVTRQEVEERLAQWQLPHVEDSSNADQTYARNRVRHQVIPVLEGLYPGFARRLTENAARLQADEDYLQMQAAALGEGEALSAAALAEAPEPIALRGIRGMLARERDGDDSCSAAHLESVLGLCRSGSPSGQVDLPGGLVARREYDVLRLTRRDESAPPGEQSMPLPGQIRFGNCLIRAEETCYNGEKPGKTEFFLPLKSISHLSVRSRREGDTLKLPGRPTKTVKKWLVDEKIPRTRRETLPVLTAQGRVAAVVGLGMEEALLPRPGEACWHIAVTQDNKTK